MKDIPEMELFDYIEATSSMACKECGLKEEINGDLADTITNFYEKGWRIIKTNPLCKNCSNLNK